MACAQQLAFRLRGQIGTALVASRTQKDALLLVFTVGTRVEPVAALQCALEVLHEELWI